MNEPVHVLALTDPAATSGHRSGAKAANLARAATAGLPVIPGFVLTTDAVATGVDDPVVRRSVLAARRALAPDGAAVVVRSSSTIEDAGTSSMAGRFTSVLDVVGDDACLAAIRAVAASGEAVRDPDGLARPMAVLVQLQLQAELGGVLFGVDPVSGHRRRCVVEAVPSRPDTLVSGTVTADHYVLSRRGRVVQRRRFGATPPLSPILRWRLARMARRAEDVFGSAQDVEWAVDRNRTLWLLQARPVTAVGPGDPGRGPLLGAGPVAETFPEPLSRLEADLWVTPLRDGIGRALRATGAVADPVLDRSPVVTTVGGWVAADLELLGRVSGHTRLWRRLSPAAVVRHLSVAWRVGRLRVALPELAASVVATVDRDLTAVPPVTSLPPSELLDVLGRTRDELRVVHTYEVLCGMLLRGDDHDRPRTGRSAAFLALRAAHGGRGAGWSDEQIAARHPVTLALSPPALLHPIRFPDDLGTPSEPAYDVDDLGPRDALRLRARWLQELGARAARALGKRLVAAGRVPAPEAIGCLDLHELAGLLADGPLPADFAQRLVERPGPPLPPAFRLTAAGRPQAVRTGYADRFAGLPAGGGRVTGEARHRVQPGTPKGGLILVTRHLEPQLAPVLPSLDGLVAETGSALSHLAILAREIGVPTVVAVHDAQQRFPPGTPMIVDGTTGEVAIVTEGAAVRGTASGAAAVA